MDLDSLRPFVALTEELNFTRAAARSFLSQPALSRRIRELEREVGQELFERDSHSVALTPAGQRFLRYAVALLELLESGLADVRAGAARPGDDDVLRVGIVAPGAAEHTGPVLATYRRRRPATSVRICDLAGVGAEAALVSGHIDVALTWGAVVMPQLCSRLLFHDQPAVAVAHGHPLAARRAVTLADLTSFRLPARQGATPGPDLVDSLRAVAMGSTIGWVPSALEACSPVPGLLYLPVRGAPPIPIVVAYRRDESRSAVRAFVSVSEQLTSLRRTVPAPDVDDRDVG